MSNLLLSNTICQKAEVADANESAGEHVKQETANELDGFQRHDPGLVSGGVVLPFETDSAGVERYHAAVRNGNPVRIPGEVFEDVLGSAERTLGVHDPLHFPQLTAQRVKGVAEGKLR